MDENKVRKAGIRGSGNWDCVEAIKAAVEPLEDRISLLEDYEAALPEAKEDHSYCCPKMEEYASPGGGIIPGLLAMDLGMEDGDPRYCPFCGTKL